MTIWTIIINITLKPIGWAIECRINGEDPFNNFAPSVGLIDFLQMPAGPGTRFDTMLFEGLDVIGGFVTEINVTSPTGIREIDKQFGTTDVFILQSIARVPDKYFAHLARRERPL
jgi:pyruvate carboxylase